MRRQRAPQEAAGVSLFSFLAVLLCTMGALIVLLVVIARQARLHAAQRATDEVTLAEDDQLARQQWLAAVERLRNERDTAAGRLADARLELSHLENHAQRLAGRLSELKSAAEDLKRAAAVDQKKRGRQQQELQMLAAHIRAVEAELEEVGEAIAQRANSYAIIPYQGPNETRRRPVYLECTAEGIVFQPEGVTVLAEHFQQPVGPGNPLAAALRAAREHLSRGGLATGGEPYPLLLVRPDGMVSYYLARAALASWGAEFGYELVDADWELDFDNPDAQLARAEREAIAAARRRQQVLARMPGRGALRAGRPVYRASRGKGGAVLESAGLPFGGSTRPSGGPRGRRGPTGGEGTFGSQFERGTGNAGGRSQGEDGKGNERGRFPRGSDTNAGDGRRGDSDSTANQSGPSGSQGETGGAGSSSAAAGAGSPGGGSGAGGERSLADARGDGWGLQGRVPGSVGIVRSIRIACGADRITVSSSVPRRLPDQQIALGRRTADSIDELMSAVWQNVENWGAAGRGMHWRPELVINVSPDAAGRFADLQSLLERSGLSVRRQGGHMNSQLIDLRGNTNLR